ncbi:MAG: glycosyl hydrolase-related protein [Candidatus Latescibacterota bacterium]
MDTPCLGADQLEEIHIIPYSHNDFSWCNTRAWHVLRYVQSLVEILDLMQTNGDVTWLIDNVLHTLVPFLTYCPERLEELKARVLEGRIAIANGGMSLARSTQVGEETFIRNMVEARRFFEKTLGVRDIDVFYNADVSCGHSQLPQLLSLAGHTYYGFWRPEESLDHKKVPKQFIWKGLDGSTITVSRGTYLGFTENARYLTKDLAHRWEEIKADFLKLELENRLRLLPTDVVSIAYGCDDFSFLYNRLNEPVPILPFVEEWNKREQAKMVFSTPSDYFHKLSEKELPTFEGVLDPVELSLNVPKKGDRSMWRMRRELDRLIVKAESLSAMASVMELPYPEDKITGLWHELFEVTGHAIEWAFEEDFNTLYDRAKAAETSAKSWINEVSERMASKVQTASGDQYVVFNTLGRCRKEPVTLHITHPSGTTGFDVVGLDGVRLDYQVVDAYRRWNPYPGCDSNALDVLVQVDVPALGYTTVNVVGREGPVGEGGTRKAAASGNTGIALGQRNSALRNGALEVFFEDGHLGDIRMLRDGKSLRASADSPVFGHLRFVQTREEHTGLFQSWEEVRSHPFVPESWGLVENGPLRWIYRVKGRIGQHRAEQDIIIRKEERAVLFDVTMDCAGGEGYFIADFPSDPDTEIHVDIPFGVEKRDLTSELYGPTGEEGLNFANSYERGWEGQFYAKSWALFEKNGIPLAVVSGNCAIYYHHDPQKNRVSLFLHRMIPITSMELGPLDEWAEHCDPHLEGTGIHHFNYAMFFPESGDAFSGIARFAGAYAQPLEVARRYPFGAGTHQALHRSFIELNRENILVSAWYRTGDDFILRLFETDGKETCLQIACSLDIRDAVLVDLMGNAMAYGDIAVDPAGRTITLQVKPWQIITIRLSAQGRRSGDNTLIQGMRDRPRARKKGRFPLSAT